MQIDNSGANEFRKCPLLYYEQRIQKLRRLSAEPTALDFGTSMHTLLAEKYRYYKGDYNVELSPEYPHPGLEAEAQAMAAAYNSYYPVEPFDVVDVERTFQIDLETRFYCDSCHTWYEKPYEEHSSRMCSALVLGGECETSCSRRVKHTYVGKFDAIVRLHDTGQLAILEHKTERRGSKSNLPEAWASRTQAQLYIHAAQTVYGEPFKGVILNVLTRQSPKGQMGCSFRRDDNLLYDEAKLAEAVRDIIWVADQIEACEKAGFWPAYRESCVSTTGWKCDFYDEHLIGWSDDAKRTKFKPAASYLSL